jgi:hypothetical protein
MEIRQTITRAETASERKQTSMLEDLSESVSAKAANSANPTKVAALAEALKNLAG